MKKVLMIQSAGRLTGMVWVAGLAFFLTGLSSNAAQMSEARVTQVIQDVKLLPSNAAPRPATINDNVREGTAVRTGQDSRTELTFPDLTLTRLGANSVFSFNAATRTLDLGQGSVLMQVPPNSPAVKVKTAAVTAAITGGTAIFGVGPPAKFMIMEGTGTFYPTGHPEEAVTLHGGEMLTLVDGKFVTQQFDVKTVLQTSELIVPFSELANIALIWDVVFQQEGNDVHGFSDKNTKDNIDQTDQAQSANPVPTGTPSKFGPPSTISSPNPYVITSGTQIQTDPTITTNGVTAFGTIYRGPALDGSQFNFLFGSTSAFDTTLGDFFNTNGNGVPVTVFKFSSLQLTGNPTLNIPVGSPTFLGLVSVGDVTSGAPGGTLTFTGLDRLFIATVNGSINLGSDISFSNIGHVVLYARGSGSNLTLGSAISGAAVVHLFSEGTVQVNGNVTASSDFKSFSGGDFLLGSGVITANSIDIESLGNVSIDSSLVPNPPGGGTSVILNAANTLNITNIGGGTFGWASFSAIGTTINLSPSGGPATIDFANSTSITITGGSGGINGSNVGLKGANMAISTTNGGNISLYSVDVENSTLSGFVHAAGSFTAQQDVATDNLTAGTSISIGGNVIASDITAGTTIDVTGRLAAFGTVTAGGNITADTVAPSNINAPNGVLTAGSGGIRPFVVIFGPGDGPDVQQTYNVKSITSQKGIDFSGNQYDPSVNNPGPGGKLTINATTIDFNNTTGILFANFNGADAGGINGSDIPANAGNGGTFIVNTTGNITTVSGSDITATTGQNFPLPSSDSNSVFSGAGGTVELNSSAGSVTVDSRIEVSSAEPQSTVAPYRASAKGGNITIHSGLTTGNAINLTTNAQLLSNLDSAAPGPGGTIMVTTAGGNIQVGQDFANDAVLEADRGTITLQTFDNALAQITIDCASFIAETVNIISSGDLTLGGIDPAPIDATTILLSAVHDLTWNGQSTIEFAFDSPGNVTVSAGNDLSILNNTTISRSNGGQTDGVNIVLSAGNNLTFGGNLTLETRPGGVTTGGNISILAGTATSGGSITGTAANPSVTAATIVESNMGTGANIKLAADGSITLGSLTGSVTLGFLGTSTNGIRNVGPPPITLTNGGNIDIITGGDFVSTDTTTGVRLSVNTSGSSNTISTGGNISITTGGNFTAGKLSALLNDSFGGAIGSGGKITFDITGTLSTTGGDVTVTISEGNAAAVPPGRAIKVTANGIDVTGNFNAYIDNSVGSGPTTNDGSAVQIKSLGGITTTGRLDVLGSVLANGAVNVGTLSVTNLDTQGNNTIVGAGGITRFSTPFQLPPDILHTLTTNLLTSAGGINFNGVAANGNFSGATNAGALTINALSLSFGSTGDIMGSVTFNGGDGSSTFAPGNGGTFTVNATNNIDVNSDIEATSGYFQPVPVGGSVTPSGDGGTVNLNSTNGTVTVNNRIEVSSAEPTSTAAPFRQSAKGGNIGITSAKTSAVAINIGSTAQLLSYLFGSAAGPGGTIAISATGNNSTIDVDNASGLIEADRGEIDIQNHGGGGMINITNADMSADVIKIQVLGLDGTLKIGGGIISAYNALNLYAAGSNGTIEFTANVTLNSNVAAVIAANTVTIDNSVTVTINSPVVAKVFTNNPNYAISSGGNGSTTGVFAGTGAPTTTQPFPPPGGPGAAATTTASTSSTSASLVSKQSQTTVASASAVTNPSGSQLKKHSLSAASSTGKTTLAARQLLSNSSVSPRRHTSLAAAKTTINVANSAQLSSMLESATESGNKVTYVAKPQSHGSSSPGTSSASQITPVSGTVGGNVPSKAGTDANVAMDRVTNFTNTNLGRPVNTASY